jgi:hypothetical protein
MKKSKSGQGSWKGTGWYGSQQIFSVRGQISIISGYANHTYLCCCSTKTETDIHTPMNVAMF